MRIIILAIIIALFATLFLTNPNKATHLHAIEIHAEKYAEENKEKIAKDAQKDAATDLAHKLLGGIINVAIDEYKNSLVNNIEKESNHNNYFIFSTLTTNDGDILSIGFFNMGLVMDETFEKVADEYLKLF